ncbi:glycosyltransferase family A protein [Arthrobacter sulfonylureivorans]|uniref:glycosyltransferase family A protein n=1 Tax=Arthrobacter sulfonylureivorans TaxID=2486855 RepID=UPI0039E34094
MRGATSEKVVALLPVYNDARYLPGWIDAIGRHVDDVIVLDDGSTDESLEILASSDCITEIIRINPEEKTEWNEPRNRELLVSAGQALGATWFVAYDADERPDARLWKEWQRLTEEADVAGAIGISQPLRELWDRPDQYRSDGIWGRKRKISIFQNIGPDHQFDPAQWHGEWYPAQFLGTDSFLMSDLNLYHLKMLRAADREQRMMRYLQLDPNREFQEAGYEYLVDEAGITLETILQGQGYVGMATHGHPDRSPAHE